MIFVSSLLLKQEWFNLEASLLLSNGRLYLQLIQSENRSLLQSFNLFSALWISRANYGYCWASWGGMLVGEGERGNNADCWPFVWLCLLPTVFVVSDAQHWLYGVK